MNAYTIKRTTYEEFIVPAETEDEALKTLDNEAIKLAKKKKTKPVYLEVSQKVVFTIDITHLHH